jgi:hypothetical protein
MSFDNELPYVEPEKKRPTGGGGPPPRPGATRLTPQGYLETYVGDDESEASLARIADSLETIEGLLSAFLKKQRLA